MLLEQLHSKRVIFVGGKGGVGKTTTSAALAVHFADKGEKTLIISTDPAHSLGDVLDVPLSHTATQVMPNLEAIELDTHAIIHQHFAQVEQTISAYTKPEMMPKMRTFLNMAHHAPGAEEAAMLEAICRHILQAYEQDYQHIIFDTAPTGHTLHLLTLPEMMQTWTDGLLAQQRTQAKLRAATQALDKQQVVNPFGKDKEDRWQKAVHVLEKRRTLFAQTRTILHDTEQTAIILVLIPESLPLYETQRAVKQLAAQHLPCTGLIINQVMRAEQSDPFWQQRAARQQNILDDVHRELSQLPVEILPLLQRDIRGIAQLSTVFSR